MESNALRRRIRKRTAMLFLGAVGSVIVSALVSLLVIVVIIFCAGSGSRRFFFDAGSQQLLGSGLIVLAGIFLCYGIGNYKKFFLRNGDDDGLFFERGEPGASPDEDQRWRVVMFAPYMFFLGLRLCGQGLILLFTPVDESERLLRTLGNLGRTDVETLAEQSGISRRRVLSLLTVLDATIPTKNREVALTSAWSKLL